MNCVTTIPRPFTSTRLCSHLCWLLHETKRVVKKNPGILCDVKRIKRHWRICYVTLPWMMHTDVHFFHVSKQHSKSSIGGIVFFPFPDSGGASTLPVTGIGRFLIPAIHRGVHLLLRFGVRIPNDQMALLRAPQRRQAFPLLRLFPACRGIAGANFRPHRIAQLIRTLPDDVWVRLDLGPFGQMTLPQAMLHFGSADGGAMHLVRGAFGCLEGVGLVVECVPRGTVVVQWRVPASEELVVENSLWWKTSKQNSKRFFKLCCIWTTRASSRRKGSEFLSNQQNTVLSRSLWSLFGPTRKSSPWGNFSDCGLNQSIKRRLSL